MRNLESGDITGVTPGTCVASICLYNGSNKPTFETLLVCDSCDDQIKKKISQVTDELFSVTFFPYIFVMQSAGGQFQVFDSQITYDRVYIVALNN